MQTFSTLTGNTCPIFPTISIVIGSWGSYNECNERALGSSWLDLSDFSDWDEIEQELKKQGFDLHGIDEELFIQDIEGFPTDCKNWDYVHPQEFFELLQQSGVLMDNHKYEKMQAFIEVCSFDAWEELVKKYDNDWDDDIYLYPNYTWEEFGIERFADCGYELPDNLECYFDYEAFGQSFEHSGVLEYSGGLIEYH